LGWQPAAAADLPRQPREVFVEAYVRAALIRLNPEIAAQPERADEVLYRLRALVLAVRSDGVPELFVCNVFSVATEGKELRFGAIHMPIDLMVFAAQKLRMHPRLKNPTVLIVVDRNRSAPACGCRPCLHPWPPRVGPAEGRS
jgi:hypothetical protein